jgi:hypothetical protein
MIPACPDKIPLFFCEPYVVDELRVTQAFDLHEKPVGIAATFVLKDGKGLSSAGRALMDHIYLRGRVLLEKVAQYELGLRFTVGLNVAFDGYIDGLIKVSGEFLRASSLDSFLYLVNNIGLSK